MIASTTWFESIGTGTEIPNADRIDLCFLISTSSTKPSIWLSMP